MKTKKLTDRDKLVTKGQLADLLAWWAQATDAAMTTKLQTMRDELREEVLSEVRSTPYGTSPLEELVRRNREINDDLRAHAEIYADEVLSAPTDSEGAE